MLTPARARACLILLFTAPLPLAASSCSDDAATQAPLGGVTYHRDVRPLIERSCATCHTADGPTRYDFTAPVPADSPPEWAAAAASAVREGRMPPWMPSDTCRELSGVRRLSDEERALFESWADNGYAMGDEAEFAPLPPLEGPADPGPPTLEITPTEPYTPPLGVVDDYRCFVLPHDFSEETYLVGTSVEPGAVSLSHHALIYMIPAASIATIEDLDAADEGPGYQCFGGPGGGALTTLGGWVPGAVPAMAAEGSASIVPAGSRLVLQMHYNTLAYADGAPIPSDQSTVQLWTSTTLPSHRLESLPLAHLGMEIEPFEQQVVEERVYTVPTDGEIVAVTPHMHVLGRSIRVAFEAEGVSEPTCMVDVPAWDFHWQQQYSLAPDAVLEVKKGDRVRVTCTYDNSAENQPILDGEPRTPEIVRWGEGTLDEMCLAYIVVRVPLETPDFRCASYPECQPTCPEGDGHCFFDCTTVGGGQCASCLLGGVFQCAPAFCASSGLALQSCVGGCAEAASSCLLYECAAEWDTFYACMEPHLEGGACNEQLAACNVEL